MSHLFQRAAAVVFLGVAVTAQTPAPQQPAPKQPAPRPTLLAKLLRIAGLTATPSQMRGAGDEIGTGNIWLVGVDGAGPSAVTIDGGYRSPVFSIGDNSLTALKGDDIVRFRIDGGRAAQLQQVTGVTKLVGFDGGDSDSLVVLLDNPNSPLGAISLRTGRVTLLPFDAASADDRRALAQVRSQERVYGDTSIYTKTETKRGLARNIEWLDVYVKRGAAAPRNISACDGTNCSQPALSADGRRIAFVKATD
jgi:hypothetical protein